MDLVRFGLIIRALRRRKGWRQLDLALAAGVSQTLISLIERGHADQVLLAIVLAVGSALDARMAIDVRWRGGELDRLLDQVTRPSLRQSRSCWLRAVGMCSSR